MPRLQLARALTYACRWQKRPDSDELFLSYTVRTLVFTCSAGLSYAHRRALPSTGLLISSIFMQRGQPPSCNMTRYTFSFLLGSVTTLAKPCRSGATVADRTRRPFGLAQVCLSGVTRASSRRGVTGQGLCRGPPFENRK